MILVNATQLSLIICVQKLNKHKLYNFHKDISKWPLNCCFWPPVTDLSSEMQPHDIDVLFANTEYLLLKLSRSLCYLLVEGKNSPTDDQSQNNLKNDLKSALCFMYYGRIGGLCLIYLANTMHTWEISAHQKLLFVPLVSFTGSHHCGKWQNHINRILLKYCSTSS